mgnify:CR=1 FL=1
MLSWTSRRAAISRCVCPRTRRRIAWRCRRVSPASTRTRARMASSWGVGEEAACDSGQNWASPSLARIQRRLDQGRSCPGGHRPSRRSATAAAVSPRLWCRTRSSRPPSRRPAIERIAPGWSVAQCGRRARGGHAGPACRAAVVGGRCCGGVGRDLPDPALAPVRLTWIMSYWVLTVSGGGHQGPILTRGAGDQRTATPLGGRGEDLRRWVTAAPRRVSFALRGARTSCGR